MADWYQKQTTAKKSKAEEARIIKRELLPRWRDRVVTSAEVRQLWMVSGIAGASVKDRAKKIAATLSGWKVIKNLLSTPAAPRK